MSWGVRVSGIEPLSQRWTSNQAVLLVHGVGNYHPGDYDDLLPLLRDQVGPATWSRVAIYPFFYDGINDWFVQKTQANALVTALIEAVRLQLDAPALGPAVAEAIGDVLWPGMLRDARLAIRDALVAQLQRMVLDGRASGVSRWNQRITVLCHSLGCFHVYEVLHAIASVADYHLRPASDWVQLHRVVMFASPVALYGSVASSAPVRPLIPDRAELASLRPLAVPGEIDLAGEFVPMARCWISITGNQDPIGGYLRGKPFGSAYMKVVPPAAKPDCYKAVIDDQTALHLDDAVLDRVMRRWIDAPTLSPRLDDTNPHAWTGYVRRNGVTLRDCFA